jgi:lysophospholipase L1-like esterase
MPLSSSPSPLEEEEAPPLRILCFGDSLTFGLWSHASGQAPYSDRLAERLRAAFPGRQIRITTDGVPGCLASVGAFTERLEQQYRREPDGFDWAIVLCGTNDIAYGVSADVVQKGLMRAWQCGFEHGARVLALTVPEVRVKSEMADKRRELLNRWIMAQQGDALYAFDLYAAIPYHSLSDVDRRKYWDDGVHLTDVGYAWMGDHIADALIEFIRNDN